MRGKHLAIISENRLINLPEPILHHIFSLLPTKEVVRTTRLLSKKWTHFSASLPCLNFNIKIHDTDLEFPCFPAHADEFLASRHGASGGPDIHTCRLED
ncbi:hypothetical protein Sjap_025518 [Stephania japonica]|uniref:F-box domain-containing protein n=1 Tax=Stephania japonica TaxID=461633 RepID=A0AAP0HHM1_9MAGN